MTQPAIRIDRLGKQYQLGIRQRGYRTFREAIVEAATAPLRRWRRLAGSVTAGERFWALKDVSFEVQPGEAVGIIGRNGAGKTTLLKILCQITEPTAGRAELYGRVGSLLEVGTGFHPELTGRENVYLNGAILGMSRREILRKFDAIVDFSEIGEFIDTPVKRYSSGMYVRLAFAVAAHLEPEILIVDEVLAVGDAEFQRKCLGKMGEVAGSGRTVLFVSHNTAAIESLCKVSLLLAQGQLLDLGDTRQVIRHYLQENGTSVPDVDLRNHLGRIPGAVPILRRFRILDDQGNLLGSLEFGHPATFEVQLASSERLRDVCVAIHIYSELGQRVATLHSHYQHAASICLDGRATFSCRMPSCRLLPGRYSIVLALASASGVTDRIESMSTFDVTPRDIYGTGRLPPARDGVFAPECQWNVTSRRGDGDGESSFA